MEEGRPRTTRLRREELHALVWSHPLTELGRQLGVSSARLAAICDEHGIPRPRSGHWTRRARGRAGPRPALPPAAPGAPREIVIQAQPPARRAPAPPAVAVPERLTDPHPLVQAVQEALESASPSRDGLLWPGPTRLAVRASPPRMDRALRMMDALIQALEARGHRVEVRPRRRWYGAAKTLAVIGAYAVAFVLREKLRAVPAPGRRRVRSPSDLHNIPSGKLLLEIDSPGGRMRKRWLDRPGKPLEASLGEVIVALEAAAEAERARRRGRE